jgi:hypothetical protein
MRLLYSSEAYSQFNHLSIYLYPIYHYFRLAFCLFCALPPFGTFFIKVILLVAAALFMLYLSQNYAWLSPVPTVRVLKSNNYTHENTGAGRSF